MLYLILSLVFVINRLLLSQVAQVLVGTSGEGDSKLSAEDCKKLGFNSAALLCSSCDDLSKFKVRSHTHHVEQLNAIKFGTT